MKKLIAGFLIGSCFTSAGVVLASDKIEALLFPVSYSVNNQEKALDDDFVTLNYNGHAYVPIRFVAESIGAGVAYDDFSKQIIIKDESTLYSDLRPIAKDLVKVSNVIAIKEGDKTRVSGIVETSLDAQVGANLSFVDANGTELGFAVINGHYSAGKHAFELIGSGDLTSYSSIKVNVGYFNRVLN